MHRSGYQQLDEHIPLGATDRDSVSRHTQWTGAAAHILGRAQVYALSGQGHVAIKGSALADTRFAADAQVMRHRTTQRHLTTNHQSGAARSVEHYDQAIAVLQTHSSATNTQRAHKIIGTVEGDGLTQRRDLRLTTYRQASTLTDCARTGHHQIATHLGNARSRSVERHVAPCRQLHMACGV